MSTGRTLPKLAAMFLTEGHRIPEELLSSAAREGAPAPPSAHPLDDWECPLDETRRFGHSPATGTLRIVPPEY